MNNSASASKSSRANELLQIASGQKSIEQVRTRTRERVKKHRAAKAAASVTVTEPPPMQSPAPMAPAEEAGDKSAAERKAYYAKQEEAETNGDGADVTAKGDLLLEHFDTIIGALCEIVEEACDYFPPNLTREMAITSREAVKETIEKLQGLEAQLAARVEEQRP